MQALRNASSQQRWASSSRSHRWGCGRLHSTFMGHASLARHFSGGAHMAMKAQKEDVSAGPVAGAPASSTSESSCSPAVAASVSLQGLVSELRDGSFWVNAKQPTVPWGPIQLVQVMIGGAAVAGGLGVFSALAGPGAREAIVELTGETASATSAAAAGALPERAAAVEHALREAALLGSVSLLLAVALGASKPRESGFFSYQLSSDWAVTTALLCAAAFPLVDPVAATAWRALLESAGGAELVANQGGSALVASVKAAAEQGDHAAVALHLLGSAGLGPAWEETFWRGFFLASLTRVLPLPVCVAISSCGFAALHLTPVNALPILLLAPLGDLLYLRSKSLGPPLLLHAAWNASQLLAVAYLGKEQFV